MVIMQWKRKTIHLYVTLIATTLCIAIYNISISYKVCVIEQDTMNIETKRLTIYTAQASGFDFPVLRKPYSPTMVFRNSSKILCWIPTTNERLDTTALHAHATWAKRCDHTVYFTNNTTHPILNVISLNITETGNNYNMTTKVFAALKYLGRYFSDRFDWFLKADEDTFVIVENLRYFLMDKEPQNAVYYGHSMKSKQGQLYFSGGAGYVVSNRALQLFNSQWCNISRSGIEDLDVSLCFTQLGIKAGQAYDGHGKPLFHATLPHETVADKFNPLWYFRAHQFWTKGPQGLSRDSISFHFIPPHHMHEMEFFLYHVTVHK